jgi:hypothetical protein
MVILPVTYSCQRCSSRSCIPNLLPV